jgi:hypothetical protein
MNEDRFHAELISDQTGMQRRGLLSPAHASSLAGTLKPVKVSDAFDIGPPMVNRVIAIDNAALRQLDLSANPLGPPSGAAFAQALAAGAVLTHLELASCRLGDGGAAALAGALAAPDCALRHLDLRSNGIGEAGVAALMGALCAPGCALESLFLWGNPGLQPGPGAEAVMEALSSGAVRAVTDLQPFEVDGEAQVAMVRV